MPPANQTRNGRGNHEQDSRLRTYRARAVRLAPLIASSEADEIERTRRLTAPVVAALIENGLYRVLLPQSTGGAEAPPEIFMQMLEEVAKADASTAWCSFGQCSVLRHDRGLSRSGHFKPARIFGAPDGILGLGRDRRRGTGRTRRLPRPWTLEFRQRLASGRTGSAPMSPWLEADGTRRRKADGSPEIRTILFPLASATTMYDASGT